MAHEIPPRHPMSARTLAVALVLALFPLACDSDPTSPSNGNGENDAVVVGAVAPSSSAAEGTAWSHGGAHTVAIGELSAAGSVQTVAEGQVEADGTFRIEGVPVGRTNLVVVARSNADAEVGRVVLHEETAAGTEHRTHPIDANSSLHARVWAQMRASASSGDEMHPAELALFIHADAGAAAEALQSSAAVAAIAQGAVEANKALTGILEAHGHGSLDAEARGALLAEVVAQRDRNRANGANHRDTQRAYASAALNALLDADVEAEALAVASAAAATGLDRAMAEANAAARLHIAREAVLLNLKARARVASDAGDDGLGFRAHVIDALAQAEAGAGAAASVSAMRQVLAATRAGLRSSIMSELTARLDELSIGVELLTQLQGELSGVIDKASLWASLETAGSTEAMVQAAADFQAEVEAEVAAFVAQLPDTAQNEVSVEALVEVLIAMGAAAHVH
jgi:hypothetical protein